MFKHVALLTGLPLAVGVGLSARAQDQHHLQEAQNLVKAVSK